ncbi:MAG: hypothetical protein H0W39_11480 [Sphingomonas sp.]|nr:hypothetical protein [Sphingomonas sp.]
MTRKLILLLAAIALPLGGCIAGIAASAAGMAIRSAQGTPQSNRHLQAQARAACSAQAAQHGAVRIIDVEQRSTGKMVVWGTATDATARRSFECAFTDRITDFNLREIRRDR